MDNDVNKIEESCREYTNQYALGLLFVALIAVFSSFVFNNITRSQESFGAVMSLSGRQRMLSQRAAFYVNELINIQPSERFELRQKLGEVVNKMEVNHSDLTQGNLEKNIPEISSEKIRSIYFSENLNLHTKLLKYLNDLTILLNAPDNNLTQLNTTLYNINDGEAEEILSLFDMIVDQYQVEHDLSTQMIKKVERGSLILLLLGLLGTGVGIFRPMIRTVKASNTELKDKELRLRTIMNNALDTMISFSAKGEILSINKAGEILFGYSSDELIGKNVLQLMPVEEKVEHLEYLKNYRKTGKKDITGKVHELGGERKDGSHFPADIVINEVVVSDTEKIFFGVIRDISERKQTETELAKSLDDLRSANGELERFTYTVSHDLKSPLVTINGFVGLLEEDIKNNDSEGIADSLSFIKKSTKTMQSLLNDLLELSRVGIQKKERLQLSFNDLIPEVLLSLTEQIKTKNAVIEIEENMPIVEIEKVRFEEVFLNLIENSLKYMEEQKTPIVKIGVDYPSQKEDQVATFYVEDNGRGIKKEYCTQIFEIFERVAVDVEGTGVGLAIVKRIIESHNGKIWVESAGLGAGARFSFTLPIIGANKDFDGDVASSKLVEEIIEV